MIFQLGKLVNPPRHILRYTVRDGSAITPLAALGQTATEEIGNIVPGSIPGTYPIERPALVWC